MVFIYDLETYPNFFLASFKCIKTNNYYEFEISDRKNDITKLRNFLYQEGLMLVGFNNVNFDYPILHKSILSDENNWTAIDIYSIVLDILKEQYSSIWDNQVKIPQLDLYRIWHYDNKNKRTSLKWLEFAMRMDNIQDLPYKPGTHLNDEQMDITISYCRNDLDATHKFFIISEKHIKIREFYSNLENINLINSSEIRMSKDIFGKYLSKEMNISLKELNQLRTYRKEVNISNIIFDYLKFNDPTNKEILEKFKSYTWVDTSNMSKENAKKYAITFSRPYKNVIREYAEGGLHSFGKAGIYESDDEYVLVDVDFKAE